LTSFSLFQERFQIALSHRTPYIDRDISLENFPKVKSNKEVLGVSKRIGE
jgi:hypothetical protein